MVKRLQKHQKPHFWVVSLKNCGIGCDNVWPLWLSDMENQKNQETKRQVDRGRGTDRQRRNGTSDDTFHLKTLICLLVE